MRALRLAGFLIGGLFGLVAAAAAFTKVTHHSSADKDSEEIDLVSIWRGTDFASTARSFWRGESLTWWGGTRIDLQQAELDPFGARLRVRTLFGGTEILVPEGWDVTTKIRAFAGGVDRPRVDAARLGERSAPTLVVTGWVAFGGVSIKGGTEPSR